MGPRDDRHSVRKVLRDLKKPDLYRGSRSMATTEGFQTGTAADQGERSKERISEKFEEVKEQARERAEEAKDRIGEAKERITDAYERTSRTASRLYQDAMDYSREHPGTAALVAFGAGIGLGMLLGDGSRESRYRRSFVPVLATAVAEAVLDIFDERR
jgi:ElaB/YqjD/DUF883 family membrane-anchored ribosome-binding protein